MFVGHTHNKLDQMFSRFCVAIRDAYLTGTYDAMDDLVREAYTPNPEMVKMEETTDVTAWLRVKEGTKNPFLERINGLNPRREDRMEHEKAHEFKVFKDAEGVTKMSFKLTQKDGRWLPSVEGKDMWLGADRPGGVSADTPHWWDHIDPPLRANPAPIDLVEIEKGLKRAKTYLPPEDREWWATWLHNQKRADRFLEAHGPPKDSRTWASFMERVGKEMKGATWRGPGWGAEGDGDGDNIDNLSREQGDGGDDGSLSPPPPPPPPRTPPRPPARKRGARPAPPASQPPDGGNSSVDSSPNEMIERPAGFAHAAAQSNQQSRAHGQQHQKEQLDDTHPPASGLGGKFRLSHFWPSTRLVRAYVWL